MRFQTAAKRFSFAVSAFLFLSFGGALAYQAYEKQVETARMERLIRLADAQREIQIRCLAENIYHEARGESLEARTMVAMVTVARAIDEDPQWPKTVCEVVAQERQYSWVLDTAIARKRSEQKRWADAIALAREIYAGFGTKHVFPHGGACIRFYARTDQRGMSERSKKFFATLIPVLKSGDHTFYRSSRCRTHMATAAAT